MLICLLSLCSNSSKTSSCRGPLSDWLGRRAAFLAATLLFLATSVPCIFAPSIYLLIVFRALQGLAVAAYGEEGVAGL